MRVCECIPFWLVNTPQLVNPNVRTKFEHDQSSGCRDIAMGKLMGPFAYQISAQSAVWLSRYSKGIYVVFVHVARAHVRKHPLLTIANRLAGESLRAYQI